MKRPGNTGKTITVFLLLLTLGVTGWSQETYRFRYVTLDSVIHTLEARTSNRFYYAPVQTDTLLLSLEATQDKVL
ncbi:MAG: hypothetical protein WC319_16255, partial [Candidatus Paceibacterota bacterium]